MFNTNNLTPVQVNAVVALMQAQMISSTPPQDQVITGGRLTFAGLTTPTGPAVVPQGTVGSTTYAYKVVATLGAGHTAASPAGSATTGNATLSATNFTLITWAAVVGATGYTIYRTTGGSTQGVIGTAGINTLSFSDTGLTADSTTAPTLNTTGGEPKNPTILSGSTDAIPSAGTFLVTTAGIDAITLNAPASGADDGLQVDIVDEGGHAHTVTTGTNAFVGSHHIATFAGTLGNILRLVAKGGIWYDRGSAGITYS